MARYHCKYFKQDVDKKRCSLCSVSPMPFGKCENIEKYPNIFKQIYFYFYMRYALKIIKHTANFILKDIKKRIMSKRERKIMNKAYKKGKDIEVGETKFGWEWEYDHFHTADGRIIRRSDYIGNESYKR